MKSSKNTSTRGLWGELPVRETHKQEVVTPDIIENIWRQVMDESNNSDCEYQMHKQSEFIQMPSGNAHVLNTVNLQLQLKAMEDGNILKNITLIEGESQEENSKETFNLKRSNIRKKFNNNSSIIHLKPSTAQGLLRHAVIVLLAHIGFDRAHDNAVVTLTDVADHFLKRMTMLLKTASEEKNYGFPDAMEKVFVETNVGGLAGLYDYYKEYILRHEINVRKLVENKMEQQRLQELNSHSTKIDLDEVTSSHQFDDLIGLSNVYNQVPTLQLLDPEMGFPPSLDAGFEMLHSLEQNELNSLEVEEEEVNNVSSDSQSANQRSDYMKK